jgi:hypothetical protein
MQLRTNTRNGIDTLNARLRITSKLSFNLSGICVVHVNTKPKEQAIIHRIIKRRQTVAAVELHNHYQLAFQAHL